MNSNFSEEDIKKLAKGTGISLFGMMTGRGLWFLCQIIIARLFGAEVFGLYILGITTFKITELFARFGLDKGAMRFVSIYRNDY
jgi:O-antigen/teichoic acid export membrane protein